MKRVLALVAHPDRTTNEELGQAAAAMERGRSL